MPVEALYQEVLKWHRIEYAITDAAHRVFDHSPGLLRLTSLGRSGLPGGRVFGSHPKVEDLFDELIGYEDDLERVRCGELPYLKIEKINRRYRDEREGYFTLTVVPFPPGLLLMATDVTAETLLAQRVLQHRNELDLLTGQLARAHTQLDGMLHRFLPHPVADQVLAEPENVRPGGELRLVTTFFADIRGYSRLAEVLEPTDLLDLLNRHFGLIGKVITRRGGLIHQYAGDMLMASFNTLDNQPDHALRAVHTAQETQAALRKMVAEHEPYASQVQFGMGVNTGPAVVGFIGYEERIDYVAIGAATNIAFRLCSKAQPGQILIGPETYAAVGKAIPARSLGELTLKNQNMTITMYEVC